MRRSSLVVGSSLLLLLGLGAGCRKTLGPETWVTLSDARNSTPRSPAAGRMFPPRSWVKAIGTTVTLGADLSPILHPDQVFYLTHEYTPGVPPQDTVPAFSLLQVKSPGGGDGGSLEVVLTPGVKVINVPVPGKQPADSTTRYFMVNFSPDTWWAGPDPSAWPVSTDGENARAVDVLDWTQFRTSPAWPRREYFGPDSFRYLPSVRRPPGGGFDRRTFYEIYGNRIYARSEGDTVHMNSWVVLYNGGYDKDSKYVPRVDPADPALPPGYASDPVRYAVLNDLGLQGSPIGFRSVVPMRLTPAGERLTPAQTSMYPDYRPTSVFRAPQLAGYWRMIRAGKAYALARSEDPDGGLDVRIADAVALADKVDAGGGTDAERAERRKIVTFYVDKAPALLLDDPQFWPKENTEYPAGQTIWFYLLAMDLDPFDPSQFGAPAGGPTEKLVLSIGFTLYGKNLAGRDTSITLPPALATHPAGRPSNVGVRAFDATSLVNDNFAGQIFLSIRVCDCVNCEAMPGSGRCIEGIDPATKQVMDSRYVIAIRPASR